MNKLKYRSSEAPTHWGLVNVPNPVAYGGNQLAYSKAIELALNKWIPIRVEDQEKVKKITWNWLCENEDGAKLIYDLSGETKICNHITWKPESKLYDIPDSMEYELKDFCSSDICDTDGQCEHCRKPKQFYALKSKVEDKKGIFTIGNARKSLLHLANIFEEKPKEETRPIDLELLQSSTAGMLSYCMDHDKNNSLIPELKKHKRTIEMMRVEDTKETDIQDWKAKYEKCIEIIKRFDPGIITMYDL